MFFVLTVKNIKFPLEFVSSKKMRIKAPTVPCEMKIGLVVGGWAMSGK